MADPFTIAGYGLPQIGEFASGLGSFASALGFGSKKKKAPSIQAQVYAAGDMAYEQLNGRLKAASQARDLYGIHPLAALGAPSGGGSVSFQSGNDRMYDLEQMGQGVKRALNAGRTAVQRRLDELAIEKEEANIDYIRSQTAASQKAISRTSSTVAIRGNPDDTGNVEIVPHKVTSKDSVDSGIAAGLPPAFVTYDAGNGQVIELPYSEEGPSESLENLPLGLDYVKFAELYGKRGLAKYQIRQKWKKYQKHHLKN